MAGHAFIPPSARPPRAFDINSILSPPEATRIESFSPSSVSAVRTPRSSFTSDNAIMPSKEVTSKVMGMVVTRPQSLISPPISPATNVVDDAKAPPADSDTSRDPVLYPIDFSTAGPVLPASEPLFPDGRIEQVAAAVDQHMRRHSHDHPIVERPTRDEYLLVATCCSRINQVVESSNYFSLIMKSNDMYRKRKREYAMASIHRKLAPAPPAKRPRMAAPPPRPIRAPKRTASISKPAIVHERLPSPVPKAPRAPTTRDDVDFESLPDFCPPLSTLGTNSKALKADWKGQALDLSQDKDRHHLHEAEVAIASTLRLSCATYLCSKRRIFQARVEALGRGKEFRKTDAQQACKIDVNKASKLWTAYDRVGWFNPDYFRQHA